MALNPRDPIAQRGIPSYIIRLPDGRSMRASGALSGDLIAQAQAMGASVIPEDAVRVADMGAAEDFFSDIGDAAMWAGERARAIATTAGDTGAPAPDAGPALATAPGIGAPPAGQPFDPLVPIPPDNPGRGTVLGFQPPLPNPASRMEDYPESYLDPVPAAGRAAPLAAAPAATSPAGAPAAVLPRAMPPASALDERPRTTYMGAPGFYEEMPVAALAAIPEQAMSPREASIGPLSLPEAPASGRPPARLFPDEVTPRWGAAADAGMPSGPIGTGRPDFLVPRGDLYEPLGGVPPEDALTGAPLDPLSAGIPSAGVLGADFDRIGSYSGPGMGTTGEMVPLPPAPDYMAPAGEAGPALSGGALDETLSGMAAIAGRELGPGGATIGGIMRTPTWRNPLSEGEETPSTGASGPLSPSGSGAAAGVGANSPGAGGAGAAAPPSPPTPPDRSGPGSALEQMPNEGGGGFDPAQAYMDMVNDIPTPGDAGLTSSDIPDALLRLGVSWMEKASQPGATALGSLGSAGMDTLEWADELEDERGAAAQAAYDRALDIAGNIVSLGIEGEGMNLERARFGHEVEQDAFLNRIREGEYQLAVNRDRRAAASAGGSRRDPFGRTHSQVLAENEAATDYVAEQLSIFTEGAGVVGEFSPTYQAQYQDAAAAARAEAARIYPTSDYARTFYEDVEEQTLATAYEKIASGTFTEDEQENLAESLAELTRDGGPYGAIAAARVIETLNRLTAEE